MMKKNILITFFMLIFLILIINIAIVSADSDNASVTASNVSVVPDNISTESNNTPVIIGNVSVNADNVSVAMNNVPVTIHNMSANVDNMFKVINCKVDKDCLKYNNNINSIETCFYNPDDNNFTWDFREEFISTCGVGGKCITPNESAEIITHTCNKSECGAECEADSDCSCQYACKDQSVPSTADPFNLIDSPTRIVTINLSGECLDSCSCSPCPEAQDKDKDGYSDVCGDQDDNDSKSYPGAEEICDGKDNNFNGEVDEIDSDGDQIFDCGTDRYIGKTSDISVEGNSGEIKVLVNGIQVNNTNGTRFVEIKDDNNTIVKFKYNFDANVLHLNEIKIIIKSGSIEVSGIKNIDSKTVMFPAKGTFDSVCVLDKIGATVLDITPNCIGDNEYPLVCNGTIQNGYTCNIVNVSIGPVSLNPVPTRKYMRVSGLKNSAVNQQGFCGDGVLDTTSEECEGSNYNNKDCSYYGYNRGKLSCSSSCNIITSDCYTRRSRRNNNNSSDNTNNTECVSDWSCNDWESCSASGIQNRVCTDLNSCGTDEGMPALTQSCTYSSPNTNTQNNGQGEEGSNSDNQGGSSGSESNNQLANNQLTDNQGQEPGVAGNGADNLLTGAVTGGANGSSTWVVIVIIILVLAVAGTVFYFGYYKKKKK